MKQAKTVFFSSYYMSGRTHRFLPKYTLYITGFSNREQFDSICLGHAYKLVQIVVSHGKYEDNIYHFNCSISQGLLVLKKKWYCLIELLVKHTFRGEGIPSFQYFDDKIHLSCMRNEFIRNLVSGALKNKIHSKLWKKLSPLPFLEFW